MPINPAEINDEELMQVIESKLNYHINEANTHLEQARKYDMMLRAAKENKNNEKKNEGKPSLIAKDDDLIAKSSVKRTLIVKKPYPKTFENIIIEILSDGYPRTVNQLRKNYYERMGINLSPKDMSSKLSIRAKNGGRIKNFSVPELPIHKRYWWGLKEWFNGNEMKEEYRQKINGVNIEELFK
jgi:hypothetical protein